MIQIVQDTRRLQTLAIFYGNFHMKKSPLIKIRLEKEFEIRMVKFIGILYWILLAQFLGLQFTVFFIPPICMLGTCLVLILLFKYPATESKANADTNP